MKVSQHLVSIIIPVFNRHDLVRETLDSVKNQSLNSWECIIVDDGSQDGVCEVIAEYVFLDERFRYYYRDRIPKGAPTCRNIGLEKARGDLVIFLDSDDLLVPDCLRNRITAMDEFPDIDFMVFQTRVFNKQQNDSNGFWNNLNGKKNDLERFILRDTPWQTTGPIWKINSVKRIGGFNESLTSWQDWEFHIRALLIDLKYIKSDNYSYDSYYRNNKSISDAISSSQRYLSNLPNRLTLYDNLYNSFPSHKKSVQIKKAFGTLYFRVLKELMALQSESILKAFMNTSSYHQIFNSMERIALRILIADFKFKNLNRIREKFALRFLWHCDQEKYFTNMKTNLFYDK